MIREIVEGTFTNIESNLTSSNLTSSNSNNNTKKQHYFQRVNEDMGGAPQDHKEIHSYTFKVPLYYAFESAEGEPIKYKPFPTEYKAKRVDILALLKEQQNLIEHRMLEVAEGADFIHDVSVNIPSVDEMELKISTEGNAASITRAEDGDYLLEDNLLESIKSVYKDGFQCCKFYLEADYVGIGNVAVTVGKF